MRLLYLLACLGIVLTTSNASANCGSVTIGEMNWNSARLIANVQKVILESGYGCKVELLKTTTVPGMTAHVETGKPDVISEAWVNSVREIYKRGVNDRKILRASWVMTDGGLEGWWIPSYLVAKCPGIDTINGLKKHWKLFADASSPNKGRFFGCPKGWGCRTINQNLFKAYRMDQMFESFDSGSGDKLRQSISSAYAEKKPWLGYYWAPTAIMGRYPMVPVKLNDADPAGHACNQKTDCEKPHAGRYPSSLVVSTVTTKFKDAHPEEFGALSKISIPNKVMNSILAWAEKNNAGGPEMAAQFLRTQRSLWTSWVSEDVVNKVEAAL